jgi:hypothetical protein
VATAGLAFCEFWKMRAETPGEFGIIKPCKPNT